jgi:hypothetical protein
VSVEAIIAIVFGVISVSVMILTWLFPDPLRKNKASTEQPNGTKSTQSSKQNNLNGDNSETITEEKKSNIKYKIKYLLESSKPITRIFFILTILVLVFFSFLIIKGNYIPTEGINVIITVSSILFSIAFISSIITGFYLFSGNKKHQDNKTILKLFITFIVLAVVGLVIFCVALFSNGKANIPEPNKNDAKQASSTHEGIEIIRKTQNEGDTKTLYTNSIFAFLNKETVLGNLFAITVKDSQSDYFMTTFKTLADISKNPDLIVRLNVKDGEDIYKNELYVVAASPYYNLAIIKIDDSSDKKVNVTPLPISDNEYATKMNVTLSGYTLDSTFNDIENVSGTIEEEDSRGFKTDPYESLFSENESLLGGAAVLSANGKVVAVNTGFYKNNKSVLIPLSSIKNFLSTMNLAKGFKLDEFHEHFIYDYYNSQSTNDVIFSDQNIILNSDLDNEYNFSIIDPLSKRHITSIDRTPNEFYINSWSEDSLFTKVVQDGVLNYQFGKINDSNIVDQTINYFNYSDRKSSIYGSTTTITYFKSSNEQDDNHKLAIYYTVYDGIEVAKNYIQIIKKDTQPTTIDRNNYNVLDSLDNDNYTITYDPDIGQLKLIDKDNNITAYVNDNLSYGIYDESYRGEYNNTDNTAFIKEGDGSNENDIRADFSINNNRNFLVKVSYPKNESCYGEIEFFDNSEVSNITLYGENSNNETHKAENYSISLMNDGDMAIYKKAMSECVYFDKEKEFIYVGEAIGNKLMTGRGIKISNRNFLIGRFSNGELKSDLYPFALEWRSIPESPNITDDISK